MRFCEKENNYKCGVYAATAAKKDIVVKVIRNLLPAINRHVEVRNNSYETFVIYPNGSIIKIVRANNSIRGYRWHGVIIDSCIDHETIHTLILPHLMPLNLEHGIWNNNDNPNDRKYYCSIGTDDVIESEKYKTFDLNSALLYKIHFKNNNDIKFEKEYEYMLYKNDYDRPVVEKEVNNDKILLYEACGISKDVITYKTEFVNKTKQTYLNIKGESKNEMVGFENDINVHLRIDTDIYDGYEVHVRHGLVIVVLHEIKNEAPVLKDYGLVLQ